MFRRPPDLPSAFTDSYSKYVFPQKELTCKFVESVNCVSCIAMKLMLLFLLNSLKCSACMESPAPYI
ncbi:hypothetical protein HanRHA438_Chr03g0111771 [Helianthus annuus]|nr:hypothetical protein HanRHA438_Chr03g0111771 [Helianthus annuus]